MVFFIEIEKPERRNTMVRREAGLIGKWFVRSFFFIFNFHMFSKVNWKWPKAPSRSSLRCAACRRRPDGHDAVVVVKWKRRLGFHYVHTQVRAACQKNLHNTTTTWTISLRLDPQTPTPTHTRARAQKKKQKQNKKQKKNEGKKSVAFSS